MLLILTAPFSYGQEMEIPHEYLIKSKYLLNIPLFIEGNSKADVATSYTICLVGDTPLESILTASKGIVIKKLPLAGRKVEEPGQRGSCQLLFILP